MQTLRTSLNELASTFVDSVLTAIRTASVDELMSPTAPSAGPRRISRPGPSIPAAGAKPRTTTSGRLPRRSADEIAAALDRVVSLVKKKKEGLRAEAIRAELGLQAKELPRILKEGVAAKKLKSKGQKRATTYFVA